MVVSNERFHGEMRNVGFEAWWRAHCWFVMEKQNLKMMINMWWVHVWWYWYTIFWNIYYDVILIRDVEIWSQWRIVWWNWKWNYINELLHFALPIHLIIVAIDFESCIEKLLLWERNCFVKQDQLELFWCHAPLLLLGFYYQTIIIDSISEITCGISLF